MAIAARGAVRRAPSSRASNSSRPIRPITSGSRGVAISWSICAAVPAAMLESAQQASLRVRDRSEQRNLPTLSEVLAGLGATSPHPPIPGEGLADDAQEARLEHRAGRAVRAGEEVCERAQGGHLRGGGGRWRGRW